MVMTYIRFALSLRNVEDLPFVYGRPTRNGGGLPGPAT